MSISPDRAPFGIDKHGKHSLDIPGVCRKPGGLACRHVMKGVHVVRQLSTKLVNTRDKGLKMVPVLNTRSLRNLLYPFPVQSDKVHPEDSIVIICSQLS